MKLWICFLLFCLSQTAEGAVEQERVFYRVQLNSEWIAAEDGERVGEYCWGKFFTHVTSQDLSLEIFLSLFEHTLSIESIEHSLLERIEQGWPFPSTRNYWEEWVLPPEVRIQEVERIEIEGREWLKVRFIRNIHFLDEYGDIFQATLVEGCFYCVMLANELHTFRFTAKEGTFPERLFFDTIQNLHITKHSTENSEKRR